MTIASDIWICHARSVVNNLVNTDNVYYYNLDIVNPSINIFYDFEGNCINRTCHGIDLLYLLMPWGIEDLVDDEALEMGHLMMDYWFNFAVNHDPNVGVDVSGTVWPEVSESENIFILDEELSTASISSDRLSDICTFFDSIGYVAPYKYPNMTIPFPSTNTTTTSDPDAKESDNDGLEGGTIAVIVIGVLVGVLVIGCLIYMAYQQSTNSSNAVTKPSPHHVPAHSHLSTDDAGHSTADKQL